MAPNRWAVGWSREPVERPAVWPGMGGGREVGAGAPASYPRAEEGRGLWRSGCRLHSDAPGSLVLTPGSAPPPSAPGPGRADGPLATRQNTEELRSGGMEEELAWETQGRESAGRGPGQGRIEAERMRRNPAGATEPEICAVRVATCVLGFFVAPRETRTWRRGHWLLTRDWGCSPPWSGELGWRRH